MNSEPRTFYLHLILTTNPIVLLSPLVYKWGAWVKKAEAPGTCSKPHTGSKWGSCDLRQECPVRVHPVTFDVPWPSCYQHSYPKCTDYKHNKLCLAVLVSSSRPSNQMSHHWAHLSLCRWLIKNQHPFHAKHSIWHLTFHFTLIPQLSENNLSVYILTTIVIVILTLSYTLTRGQLSSYSRISDIQRENPKRK